MMDVMTKYNNCNDQICARIGIARGVNVLCMLHLVGHICTAFGRTLLMDALPLFHHRFGYIFANASSTIQNGVAKMLVGMAFCWEVDNLYAFSLRLFPFDSNQGLDIKSNKY